MKDFSEFADIISERQEIFANEALRLVDLATEDNKLDIKKFIGYLPAFNLKTCLEVLEQYHEWIFE